jgi:glutamate dehydrogenase (NADP+)
LGPYQGGIRFHPSVDEGVLKFLGFEQTLKNALAGVPLGGGQGGSDFDPKGKSEAEVRRFCDVFMVELNRYLDPQMGIPAGHIGDDNRDLGYLYAQYKNVPKESARALKGTPLLLGRICPEAAGFGVVHIAKYAIEKSGNDLNGARCAVSGSGNVAQYVTKKLIELGGKVVSLSDSNGTLTFENGMTASEWKIVFEVSGCVHTTDWNKFILFA